MLDVRFSVAGTPVPKGSMSGFPIDRGPCPDCLAKTRHRMNACFGGRRVGVSMTDQGDSALKSWQQLVQVNAISARNKAAHRIVQAPGAVSLTIVFVMPRPAGHWTVTGILTPAGRSRPHPTVKPDVDKLARAILDAMTDAIVTDDGQVTVARLGAVYANWKGWTGVTIHARQLVTHDAWVEHELSHHGVWRPESAAQGALL